MSTGLFLMAIAIPSPSASSNYVGVSTLIDLTAHDEDTLKSLIPVIVAILPAEKKYRILVVDDEPDIATIMKLGLEKQGFEVEAITDPLKALEYYEKDRRFDLALIDIKMTPINGFELYRRLLNIDNKLRVCFITAFEIYYDEFKRVFPKIRVDCFVHKPVKIDTLVKIIKSEIERIENIELPKVE